MSALCHVWTSGNRGRVIIIPVTAIRAECARFAGWEIIMTLPVDCSRAAVTMRATISDGPPGVLATTNFTGRSG